MKKTETFDDQSFKPLGFIENVLSALSIALKVTFVDLIVSDLYN